MNWLQRLYPHGSCRFEIEDLKDKSEQWYKGYIQLSHENEMLKIQIRSLTMSPPIETQSTLEMSLNELLAKANTSHDKE